MAILSLIDPSGYSSVQDSLWHIAESDASGLTNFKYVFDVYDDNNNQLIRSKIYPDVNTGKGYFDAGSVVRNEMTYNWFNDCVSMPENFVTTNADAYVKKTYKIYVGEEYNVGASGITNVGLVNSTTNVYNYFPKLFERRVKTIYDKYDSYLTNRPLYANISYGERLLIPYYLSGSKTLEVKKYNEYNTLISTNTKSRNFGATEFHELDLGMAALNNEFGTSIFTAADLGYYIVKIGTNAFRVNIVCVTDYEPINLYFINEYGMFDSARFDCMNKLNMNITRKSFDRKEITFADTSVDYFSSNNVYNETKINYSSNIDWGYKLMMNFPTDEEWEWLAELIYSPQIFMKKGDYYYPVTIKATNYEYYKRIYSKLKTFDVEIEINQKRNGFRR